MKFSLPYFTEKKISKTNDGAFHFNQDIRINLKKTKLEIEFHSFTRIIRDEDYAKKILSEENLIVFTSIGPYAYFYFYLREKLNLNFHIIRDIHGALYTGYLFQEWLSNPLTRKEDLILFPSNYCLTLYRQIFSLLYKNAIVAHPMFTKDSTIFIDKNKDSEIIKIGYIGRLSYDKNLDDLIALYGRLQKNISHIKFQLNIIGGEYDINIHQIKSKLYSISECPELKYWGFNLPQNKINEFYREIDILLFCSTSNVEALGRVVIEAKKNNIVTFMADHAAARELLNDEYILPIDYLQQSFSTDNCVRMANVNIDESIKKISNHILGLNDINFFIKSDEMFDYEYFVELVVGFYKKSNTSVLNTHTNTNNLCLDINIEGLSDINSNISSQKIKKLLPHMIYWTSLSSDNHLMLENELFNCSFNISRTQTFLELVKKQKINYSDLYFYPYHLARLSEFYPICTINPN